MTKIADKVREAENSYKQIYQKRLGERVEEQSSKKIHNANIQIAGEAEALKRKIMKRRAKGK